MLSRSVALNGIALARVQRCVGRLPDHRFSALQLHSLRHPTPHTSCAPHAHVLPSHPTRTTDLSLWSHQH